MILFLPKDIWENKQGAPFGETPYPLKVGYHTGQDFHTTPVGKIPVIAPCNGYLTTFPFSKSAGWWGYFKFNHNGEIYSLKILHMYKQMKDGEYKAEDVFGYCGATGLSITKKYGSSFIGESHEEQTSDKAVGHLHVELHKGEFKHETNQVKELADERIIDPIINFEKWVNEMLSKNTASPAVSEKQEGPIQQSKTVDFKEQKEIRQKEEKPSNLQSKTDNSVWVKIVEMLREWLKVKK